jgi:IPT/TIG domain-containing protein
VRNRKTIFVVALVMFVTLVGAVIREPAVRAGTPDHFEIFFVNTDNKVRMGRFSFDEPLWQFGDRPGYRCAWAFLMADGVPVARVQFDRGQTYTSINDKYGDEKENDGSQCLSPGEELEVKPKPAGLADTIVNFVYGGSTIASLNFPATSPEDPDSWWELEEADPDHVEIELYWQKDVAVIATVTSLSPGMSLSTRSSEPPRINSFSPVSGRPGTAVTILGANFVAVTSVTFDRLPAEFQVKSAGEIVATVPEGATGSGPIAVTTATGTGTSRTEFSVADHVSHVSRVSLKLSGRLVASGSVTSIDGEAACARRRTVVIERRYPGKWKDVGKDKTSNAGSYREKLRNRGGKYRARVKKSTLANGDVCLRDVSAKRVH